MKQLSTLIILLFFSINSFAQEIQGKVIESENSIELSNVQIFNSENIEITTTNNNGIFILPTPGSYTFKKEGFQNKTIDLKSSKFVIIELNVLPENLNEIQITASNLNSQIKSLPTAISVISTKEIENSDNVNMTSILNTVPGVVVHNGTLTTNKINIRGIGSRNLYGTSKLRAYYQDIPLTNGSGESTIEDIEITSIGRIEILKGPSSSIYGAGLGGTIQLIPNKGLYNENSIRGGYIFGSYGLQKYLAQVNLGNDSNSANIIYTNTQKDGYRDNNQLDKQSFSVATNHFIGESDKLTFIGNYIDLKAFIPSSINEETYLNEPTSADFRWGQAKGYEDYTKGLFGISWQHDYNSKTTQYTSVFTSFFDSYEAKTFEIEGIKNNSIGLRTRFVSNSTLFNKPLEWTIGGELFNDNNKTKVYENLFDDTTNGSVEGSLTERYEENRRYFNVFIDSKLELTSKTNFTFGVNLNKTSYDLDDQINSDSSGITGDYSFDAIFSPKFGLTHQINDNIMIYETASHGFSPPTLEETLQPDGQINPDIKPESGWNFEIGSRGKLFNKKLNYDIALYKMDVKNLLVPRRTGDEEFVGINAGKTEYTGLEFGVGYNVLKTEKLTIYHSNALNFTDFKFKDFVDEDSDEDYSGNRLTGVPKFTFNSQLNFDSKCGIYAFINYNYTDKIPMRDDNSIYSDSYKLVNTRIGYKSNFSKKYELNLFLGINNVFDEQYASMLLINAPSFGGRAPRYYYPGEPTNYYSGFNLKYIF
ncbi:TonB-dependent receptor domain-containing protein [Urechidicola croceus]|uniref:TonB-dependent receptor n=1 Tax=Urechidicola croceus TaxID=1850246 RepID=A0A1D8P6V4_9FLAO|nr:TonB-dependent receptor [Urechidicola croceus]AOW20303.1 hypothetical protein LPB138_06250 [Urechidicola croceus]